MDYQQSFRILIPSCSSEKKGWHTTMEHYRKLNAQTIPDRHPLPRIQTIIDSLGKNQYLSLLDQTKVYRQLHMDPESRKFTSFLTLCGFYEWVRIPCGLMNAAACFQRFMESCLGEYRDDFAISYWDDLLVYSGSFEDHLKHLRLVLQRLKNMALTLRHLNVNYLKGKFLILGM